MLEGAFQLPCLNHACDENVGNDVRFALDHRRIRTPTSDFRSGHFCKRAALLSLFCGIADDYLWLASPASTLRVNSADLLRGTDNDFHPLALKCFARKTICPQ